MFRNPIKHLYRLIRESELQPCALQHLSMLRLGYLPWSESAMAPNAIVTLVNEVLVNKRCDILELGSGISTIFLAAAVKLAGAGHVHSIDHNLDWIDIVAGWARREGLLDYITFVHAPLIERQDVLWPDAFRAADEYYDTANLPASLASGSQNLMLVDAPPAYKENIAYSRFPALQIFGKYLASECTIVLDDIGRKAEAEMIRQWGKSDSGFTIELKPEHKIGILSRGHRWTV